MKHTTIALVAAAVSVLGLCSAAHAQDLAVTEHTLSNGLKLFVHERPESTNVDCRMTYRVGSVDEWAGVTGMSHFVEHLMFKGTTTLNAKNYEEEARLLKHEDDLVDALQLVEDDARRLIEIGDDPAVAACTQLGKLQKQLADKKAANPQDKAIEPLEAEVDAAQKALGDIAAKGESALAKLIQDASMLRESIQAVRSEMAKLVTPTEFDNVYSAAGGTGLNASTAAPRTEYTVALPPEKLELFFWVEADRLSNPIFREFYKERDVVTDERLMRVENFPLGRFLELVLTSLFEANPINLPTVGWPSDLARYTRPMAVDYFQRHYRPDNAAITLVGNLKAERAIELAERYFGAIRNPDKPLAKRVTRDLTPIGQRKVTVRTIGFPICALIWQVPATDDREVAALELLAEVLNSDTGVMRKRFVDGGDAQLAQVASLSMGDTNVFALIAGLRGLDPVAFQPRLEALVQEIGMGVISPDLLAAVKRRLVRERSELMEGNAGIASLLSEGFVIGDWRAPLRRNALAARLEVADLAAVARKYLDMKKAVIGHIHPVMVGFNKTEQIPVPSVPVTGGRTAAAIVADYRKRFPKVHFDAETYYDDAPNRSPARAARK